MITGRGLTLTPGVGNKHVITETKVKLIRPDTTELFSVIKGIGFDKGHSILLAADIKKEDVPIGTEVWLMD